MTQTEARKREREGGTGETDREGVLKNLTEVEKERQRERDREINKRQIRDRERAKQQP